jgi:Spy/CpxP family protein refolding chaperone
VIRSRCSPFGALVALVALVLGVAVFAVHAPAAAQGTGGALPGPINSRLLEEYGDRLELSREQRAAWRAIHDEYKQDFRLLREGDIAVFLNEQRSMQGGIPERGAVEKLLGKLEQIQQTIKAVDDRFFDRLRPYLTAEQQKQLPRLRMARARARFAVLQTAARYGRKTVDLGELLYTMKLAPESMAAADPIVASYERRLTGLMRDRHRAGTRMTLNLVEALEERGYVDVSQDELLADPEKLQKLLGEIQTIYAGLNLEVAEIDGDIRDLNKRTCRRIENALPPPEARRFRNGFYRGAYPELGSIIAASDHDWTSTAHELEDLTDEERAVLVAGARSYHGRIDRLLEEGIEAAEDFWDNISPFQLNQQAVERLEATLGELATRSELAREQTTRDLEATLGNETVARVRQLVATRAAAARAETETSRPTGLIGEAAEESAADDESTLLSDRFVPPPLGIRHVERYARALGFDDERRAVLQVLRDDYLQQLMTLDVFAHLGEAKDAARGEGSGSGTHERVSELRRQALAAVHGADDAFFVELEAIAGEDRRAQIARLRRRRERECYSASASAALSFGRDRSREAEVDLSTIVIDEAPATGSEVRAVLDDYETQVVVACRARLEAQLDLQQIVDGWRVDIGAAAQGDIRKLLELQNRYRKAMRPLNARVAETNGAIIDLNRATLERLETVLDRDTAWSIRDRYDRESFPTVFEDAAAIEGHLARALTLPDLSSAQMDELSDLAVSYRPRYEELSRAMIEVMGPGAMPVVGIDTDAFREWQGHQQKVAKLRFDRNELNASAIAQLREILSPEQIERLGGLPEPLGEDDFYIFR